MNALTKIFIAGLLAGTVSAPALAQVSSGQSTSASVTIIRPVVLTKVTDLSFGAVTRPTTGTNTITMSVASDTPTTSTANTLATGGSARTRASYTVTGETARTVAISLSSSTITLTRGGGSETLSLALTLEAATDTLDGAEGTFSGDGTLYVGGAIAIADTTVSGAYSGSFTTTVAYN